MKIRFTIIVLFQTIISASCQTNHDYYSSIIDFYNGIFKEEYISIEKCIGIFGEYCLEEEEALCFKKCDSLNKYEDCNEYVSAHLKNIKNSKSIVFSIISDKFKNYGYNFLEVYQIKQNSTIIDYGNPSYLIIRIIYNENSVVYFKINKYIDEKPYIQDVFVNNGESIFNGLETRSDKSIELKAIINDKDGYTNIRKTPNSNSEIIGKIVENEQFLFTPDYDSSWWKIETINHNITGYIHKSRISLLFK